MAAVKCFVCHMILVLLVAFGKFAYISWNYDQQTNKLPL